jgi:hypothetical protein
MDASYRQCWLRAASVDDLPMVRRELAETAARLDAAKVRAMAEAPA